MHASPLFVAAFLAAFRSVDAFWRLPCQNSLVVERADPIVTPGQVAPHVHNFVGGSNVNLEVSFDSLRQSDCTSCLVKQDLSAYWTPQLYFHWANGSFTNVDWTGAGLLIYYLQRYNEADTTNITAFPDGFRMLTGDPFKRSYEDSLTSEAIGWNCLGADVAETRQPYLPPYNCPNGLRGEIRFPSCWDGVNLDSGDHFSHMAYPLVNEVGPCPASHPVRVVTLFYEMMYDVDSWKDLRSQAMNASQPFVLAFGDPTGYGWHGDFFNGWDRPVLQKAIDTCTDPSGIIEKCDVFDLYDYSHQCHTTPAVDEDVLGTLASLPGNNPVTGFGGMAPMYPTPPPPPVLNSTAYTGAAPPAGTKVGPDQPSVLLSYVSDSRQNWTYVDCYSDLVPGRALPNGLANSAQTVEGCLEACSAKNYAYCGVEYHGECWGANTLNSASQPLGAGACGLTCSGNPLEYCGGVGGPTGAAFAIYRPHNITNPSADTSTTSPALSSTITSALPATSSSAISSTSTLVSANSSLSSSAPSSTTALNATTPAVTASTSQTTAPASANVTTSTITTKTSSSSTVSTSHILTTSSVPATTNTTTSAVSSTISKTSSHLSTSVSSSTTTSAASAASPTATTPSSTKVLTNRDWTYKGCWSDLVSSRALPVGLTGSSNYTIEGCLAAAAAGGYAVAGLSYYGECWAAAGLSYYSQPLDASKCTYPCRGDSAETCGGSDALDVYDSTVIKPVQGATNADLATFGPWKYDACYQDLVNGQRSLPTQITNSNDTIEACLDACSKAGAQVCGLEYYGQCWMSKTDILASAYVVPDTKCRFACSGNPNSMCGGSGTLGVWRLQNAAVTSSQAAPASSAPASSAGASSTTSSSGSSPGSGSATASASSIAAQSTLAKRMTYVTRRSLAFER
ncbi:hypothetical protein JCM8202_003584 [Rhodotorula sphaerocarpa]